MKKTKLKHFLLSFTIPFLLWNCEKGNIEPIEEQQRIIETVAIDEAVDFFNLKALSDPDKSAVQNYASRINNILWGVSI